MARRIEKEKAIQMRSEGKTYSEIMATLQVPKGTLSGWLKDYPLTETQLSLLEQNIKYKKQIGIERTIAIKRKNKQLRLDQVFEEQRKTILPLSEREQYIAGLLLYWGEGQKWSNGTVSLNNTDPKVVKFFLYWLVQVIKVPKDRVKVLVHLYNDMDIEGSLQYWENELRVPRNQFVKPYIKKSLRSSLTQKGFGHGTCGIYICDQYLKEKMMAGIDIVADFYGNKH